MKEEQIKILEGGICPATEAANPQKFVSFFQFKHEFRRRTHCMSPTSPCPEPFISKQEGFCSEVEV